MIFFEEQHQTGVMSRHIQLIKDSICFPPPVVLRLREFGFAIMSIQVWMESVIAFSNDGSGITQSSECQFSHQPWTDLLVTFHIARTIAWISSGKLVLVSLYRMWIENLRRGIASDWRCRSTTVITHLHNLAEVNRLHQFIDVFIIEIMREYQQDSRYISCLCQTYN